MQKRRNDEGYALVFALVVLLVLSIVGMTIMTLTYRDLKAQQDSIARMKDQYAAQGELEMLIAELENASESELDEICARYTSEADDEGSTQENPVSGSDEYIVTVHLERSYSKYKVTIDCSLKLSMGEGRNTVEYNSYSISSEKLPEPENGGVS